MRRNLSLWVAAVAAVFALACGSWAGNPGKDEDEEEDGQNGPPPVVGGNPGPGGRYVADRGDVLLRKVRLTAGQPFTASASFRAALALVSEDKQAPIEISVVDETGRERAYERRAPGDASIGFTADEDGEYLVALKTNVEGGELQSAAVEGAAEAGPLVDADDRTDAPHKNLALKGFVVLARECREHDAEANVTVVPAPAGRYFVQPFVFYGEVGADKKVTPLDTATMRIVAGGDEIPLVKLAAMPRAQFRDVYTSSTALSEDEERTLVRGFFQGYFGAPGELYTVPSFRKNAPCAEAGTIALAGDVGAASIELVVEDATRSPALSRTFALRATVGPAFSIYEGEGRKVTDWTQCTYDRLTGEPKTYNGDAASCKSLSLSDPPYVTLDYRMPSETEEGLTALSDPTRILYYGHAHPKAWYKALIEGSTALAAAPEPSVSLDRCLSVGGLVAMPLSAEKTYMPLAEFNVEAGDVLNVARRAGSHTLLADFYQGNVDASASYKVAACIPSGGEACASFRVVTVDVSSCSFKADSGLSVAAISDAYVYPEFFEISGVVGE